MDFVAGDPVYYFGHGNGNPLLSFIASNTTEQLTFSSFDAQQIVDEVFALDNVIVTGNLQPNNSVPAPATLVLLGLGFISLGFTRKKSA